jgi:hypothetical protein
VNVSMNAKAVVILTATMTTALHILSNDAASYSFSKVMLVALGDCCGTACVTVLSVSYYTVGDF